MRHGKGYEPVFVRSRWGTSRYVLNYRNPVGLALILIVPILVIALLVSVRNSRFWSDGELRDAVHQAADSLEEEPHTGSEYFDYSGLIDEAVADAGEGDAASYRLRVEAIDDSDYYEITADGTDAVFCMSVLQSPSEKGGTPVPGVNGGTSIIPQYDLTATVHERGCRQVMEERRRSGEERRELVDEPTHRAESSRSDGR